MNVFEKTKRLTDAMICYVNNKHCEKLESGTSSGLGGFSVVDGKLVPVTSMIISEDVTEIPTGALRYSTLTTIQLPPNLEIIGDQAFDGAETIDIIIPDSVTSIGEGAFSNMYYLNSLIIGEGINALPDRFAAWSPLPAIVIPSNIQTIGEMAFFGARSPLQVTFEEGVVTIETQAFSGTEMGSITFPNSLETLGMRSFADAGLNTINWGTGLKSIGEQAFADNSITSIVIPDSVTSIGSGIFNNNSITSLTLGTGLVSIPDSAFSTLPLTSLTIPEEVTSIGSLAFSNAPLGTITLPVGTSYKANSFRGDVVVTGGQLIP